MNKFILTILPYVVLIIMLSFPFIYGFRYPIMMGFITATWVYWTIHPHKKLKQ